MSTKSCSLGKGRLLLLRSQEQKETPQKPIADGRLFNKKDSNCLILKPKPTHITLELAHNNNITNNVMPSVKNFRMSQSGLDKLFR